ncbi:ATP:guanido phosphotransferase, catalytic domain protein [Clostridiales bacterium KA00134]|nr:ATP:guanido phosphotransferase, catalytic domain protein [Clostridiales bacterium KA00134]
MKKMTDYVISSMARLHRNLLRYPFVPSLNYDDAIEVSNDISIAALDSYSYKKIDLRDLSLYETIKLKNDKTYTQELSNNSKISSVLRIDERRSILINEFDHMVIQSYAMGKDLESRFLDVKDMGLEFEKKLDFAFDKRFGFLTSAPLLCGTGLVINIKLHLPALSYYGYEIVARDLRSFGFSLFPNLGKENKAIGDIFYLTNISSIGNEEEFILQRIENVISRLQSIESSYRQRLFIDDITDLEDKVYRSKGILENARIMGQAEALNHLSNIKLGLDLNILQARFETNIFTEMEEIRSESLQEKRAGILDKNTRRQLRASKLRRTIKERII